jgi:hypothetical protein
LRQKMRSSFYLIKKIKWLFYLFIYDMFIYFNNNNNNNDDDDEIFKH